MMDARRSQVYTGIYRFENHEMKTVLEQKAMSVEDAAAELNRLGGPAILLGDGTAVYMEKLEELLKVPFSAAPASSEPSEGGSAGSPGRPLFPGRPRLHGC